MATARQVNFDSESFNKYTTHGYYLSKGASGNVYGPIQWNDMQLAIKQVMFADGKVTEEFKNDIQVKKEIWTSLEHTNLARIHSVDFNQLPQVMFIVMEFAAGGSLHKTLRLLGSENKLPIGVVTEWATQIADGMLYLHDRNIVHRDLKSSNILLTEPFDIQNSHVIRTLKIADFDEVKEYLQTTTMSLVGTYAYMAPEVLVYQRFSKASDVWSLGVVIWEMLSGDIPHSGLDSTAIIRKAIQGELDNLPMEQSFPEDYKLILKRCWKSTSKKRLSFLEIFCVLQLMADGKDVTEMLKYKRNMLQKYVRVNPQVLDQAVTENEDFIARKRANFKLGRAIRSKVLRFLGREETARENECDITGKIEEETTPAIFGLAVLDQEVFISRPESPDIEVYDSATFYFMRKMTVDGMEGPQHIVSCSINNCLYASDWRYWLHVLILRIDPTDGNVVKTWTIDGRVGRLSIATDTNVIAMIDYGAKLHEYTAHGELIRKINLDAIRTNISRARYAVKLNSDQFVVCHGGYDDPLNRICLLSVKSTTQALGRTDEVDILKEFITDQAQPIKYRCIGPTYLSVDKEGSIMVSYRSRKTILLSCNFDKPQIIVSEKHGLRSSWRTCFNQSTGQWLVADHYRVMVCQVKHKTVERTLFHPISN